MDVTQMQPGDNARVINILGGFGLIRKLDALGVRNNTIISKTSSQFMRGPVTIRIGNTQIALGYGMARKMLVEKL